MNIQEIGSYGRTRIRWEVDITADEEKQWRKIEERVKAESYNGRYREIRDRRIDQNI